MMMVAVVTVVVVVVVVAHIAPGPEPGSLAKGGFDYGQW